MGNSTWCSTDTVSYRSYAKAASATNDYREVFKKREIARALDPRLITMRESVDSDANPNSNAIIIGLDVSGSMGQIAHAMAKEGLGVLVEGLLDRQSVSDPHILFMGIGDAIYDKAPLQVTQFEADIKIVDQLSELFLEGAGGGNQTESYDLPWIFAAHRTKIDCFDKRGRKGYLFTIGDECEPTRVQHRHLVESMGEVAQMTGDYLSVNALAAAQERYHVFHIIVEQGNYARSNLSRVKAGWTELLGRRAILLDNYNHISQVILSAIELSEGKDIQDVLEGWESEAVRKTIKHAFCEE